MRGYTCIYPTHIKRVGSLDVSGGVNCAAIVVGGSTAKQIDCGYSSIETGTTGTVNVNFNFTFTNAPKVVVSGSLVISDQVWSFIAYNITTTGFTVIVTYTTIGSFVGGPFAIPFNWIAVG